MKMRQDDEKMKYFVHRIVTILIYQRTPSGIVIGNASGFPIEVNGQWWLATAGHVINGLRTIAHNGTLERMSLCDAWTGLDGTGHPIPFPIQLDDWFTVGNDDDRLDLGAIKLSSLMVGSLRAGRTEVIPESDWKQTPKEFDHYFLLGTPRETISLDDFSKDLPRKLGVIRGLFRLFKIPRPENALATQHERFYGKISDGPGDADIVLNRIEGVSGGPIFGGKNVDGGVRMWAIGVQSSWLRSSKIVTADYLLTLGNAIVEWSRPA